MNKDFNLLDEPWLPVRLADGRIDALGLLDVFRRSGEITALADTAPPNLVAQYRLLLAILHRALTLALPEGWKDRDRARWYREGLPVEAIIEYLEHWRERFWLFHPEYPFMQVAALAEAEETKDKKKPWTQIALASANGNTPVVFDHACDAIPTAISPSSVIGNLLGFLQFTPGGLVKTLRDSDKAGALANTAAVLPVGINLTQTLVLCLHPWRGSDDAPAWEREPLAVSQLRAAPVLATGPNDRYTRQSRAVLLLRETDGSILWLHFAAGFALEEDANSPDSMASFRVGSNGPVRLSFVAGRALWRDLPALVPNPSGTSQPAAVLSYALALHDQLDPFESSYQPLLIAGLASDQAKLLRWRSESIVLPVALLEDADKARYLRELVEKAEDLFSDLRKLAVRMLAETLPDAGSKDTYTRARSILDASPFTTRYYATAERTLPELLGLLGEGDFEQATERWHAILRSSALVAWEQVSIGLGRSSRALRADARCLPRFHGLLNKHVPVIEPPATAKEA
ncbi:type I-E CRISPR-associated protein Cse1/CasA [Pseudomonas sp. S 311-6]|uniref:type I-E CRISPR-associated protein Cse1/CasA n=1 Tax=Kerstersia gyiorum TaxID=206506 RepID=UPI002096DFB9|nr:type I-E CRISPR-associated protein Cse1/CasA [Pseudomonas sp. S 311-6]